MAEVKQCVCVWRRSSKVKKKKLREDTQGEVERKTDKALRATHFYCSCLEGGRGRERAGGRDGHHNIEV